eukprot:jgi/Chrzof1/4614/Cz14g20020.t1
MNKCKLGIDQLCLYIWCILFGVLVIPWLALGANLPQANAANTSSYAADQSEQLLLDWVITGGGYLAVDIGRKSQGFRGLIAKSHVKSGDVVASIPVKRCLPLPVEEASFSEVALALTREMIRTDSEYSPYLRTLPRGADMAAISYETIPLDYLPLIESEPVGKYIMELQQTLTTFWVSNAFDLVNEGITVESIKHSLALITTRIFSINGSTYTVPVLDMGNHYNHCQNFYYLSACMDPTQGMCITLEAGKDISQGDEVCLDYGYLTPDAALLNYGFLSTPDASSTSELHSIDRHDFTYEQLHDPRPKTRLPAFSGTEQQMRAEIAHLQQLLAKLRSHNSIVDAGWPLSPNDPTGAVLSLLKEWRMLRQSAIEAETQRLSDVLLAVTGRLSDAQSNAALHHTTRDPHGAAMDHLRIASSIGHHTEL